MFSVKKDLPPPLKAIQAEMASIQNQNWAFVEEISSRVNHFYIFFVIVIEI